MDEIVNLLEKRFPFQHQLLINDAFFLLIVVTLAQNTNNRNFPRAFHALKHCFEVKPEALSNVEPDDIHLIIQYTGLQEVWRKRIIAISKTILQKYNGDLTKVLRLLPQEACLTLINLNGVGLKTADILLNFLGGTLLCS